MIRSIRIETPEGVMFSWPLAGITARFLAWSIDTAAVIAAISVLQNLFAAVRTVSPDVGVAIATVSFFVLNIGYNIVLEWRWRGQTIGKRVLKIRVIDSEGLKLQPSQIIVRNLLRTVDSLPLTYGIGGLCCLITRRTQRLGDLAAGTAVIQHVKDELPDLTALARSRYNSLRDYPHLAARLRQRCTPQEAVLALQALQRRDHLDAVARLQLFDELERRFRDKVEFPEEATEGLTGEQYVRGVVQILFEQRAPARSR